MALLIAFLDITQGKEKKNIKICGSVACNIYYCIFCISQNFQSNRKALQKKTKKQKTVLEDNTILIK